MSSDDTLAIAFALFVVSANVLMWLDSRRAYKRAKATRQEALAIVQAALEKVRQGKSPESAMEEAAHERLDS